jgi:hypothetical protein
MLCFTRLVFFILSQITLGILCEQKDSQTIKIVNGFDTLRQLRGENVEPNSLINEIFSRASSMSSNETDRTATLLAYNKEKYHKFMTNDQSGLFSSQTRLTLYHKLCLYK